MATIIELIKNGTTDEAFLIKEIDERLPNDDEIGITIEAFGLNFAEVLARTGNYPDCPPLPTTLGYEVIGRIKYVGKNVTDLKEGQRVVAITNFNGYSNYVVQKPFAIHPIDEDINASVALALVVQYCTAYYCTHIAARIFETDKILIHTASNGVGIALIQLCTLLNTEIYATARNIEKLNTFKNNANIHLIDCCEENWFENKHETFDFIFDNTGGSIYKKYISMLKKSGSVISYGSNALYAANETDSKMKTQMQYGMYHPLLLISESKSIIGVNLIHIGKNKPDVLNYCLEKVFELYNEKKIHPLIDESFHVSSFTDAQKKLEKRNTIGKICIYW